MRTVTERVESLIPEQDRRTFLVSGHGMHRYHGKGLVRVHEVTDPFGNRGGTANENIRPRGGLCIRLGDFFIGDGKI